MQSFLKNFEIPTSEFQKEAYEKLLGFDFPTTKDEYWKYTRLGKLSKTTFNDPKSALTERINLNEYIIANDYIVIENGIVREDLSQYSQLNFDVHFRTSSRMGEQTYFNRDTNQNDLFVHLNNAYFDHVVEIVIGENKVNEGPLQLIFVNQGQSLMSNNRVFIKAGRFSKNEIIGTFVSKDGSDNFTNQITEIYLEENAHLTYNKLQLENESTYHISTEQVYQEYDSNFKINTFTLNGKLVRNNLNILVDGKNCETYLNGAIITKDAQHIDNHTFVHHKISNCYSNENYKYVLADKSTGVFNGKVVVKKDAQQINAYQNNANILTSDLAAINSKPELEIYADDVKCSHGSTTGQLDEEALFYLQSRGISKKNATQILVHAFLGEIIEEINNPHLAKLIENQLERVHGWNPQ